MLLIAALTALTSSIDPKVKLVHQKPRAGSNQWDQVVFNDYCYEKSGDSGKTEVRTRAMADLFGQAARLLSEKDTDLALSVRTFYKAQDGTNTPRLHISIRPGASTSQTVQMDVNSELADYTAKAAGLGFDFNSVPAVIAASPAAFLGFLKNAVAKLGSAAVTSEVAAAGTTAQTGDGAPPL